MTYFIYHIPGKKIGVTCDLNSRLTKQQGYKNGEYEVLLSSEDIDYVSDKERELQIVYGYKVDRDSYKDLIVKRKQKQKNNKIMVLNVTEQTTTFPCPVNKLKGQLLDSMGLTFETQYGKYVVNSKLVDWIMDNVKASMYNPSRSYVYNKALHEFFNNKEVIKEKEKEAPNVYDLIRQWADERGIYKNGDVKTQYVKLIEESGELAKAILKNDKEEFIDAIGDMIVVLTNLAALEGLKVEDCIASAYSVIKNRQGKMENGTFVKQINNHLKSTL